MSLKDDLEAARPGDTVTFRGRQSIGKVFDIRGTASAWIELAGADETAVLVPDPGYTASVFRPEDCAYFRFGNFAVDGDGRADRCIQVFTSEHIEIHDLKTAGVPEDHIHIVGCNHVAVRRCYGDGAGGQSMGGGKGPHMCYFTRVDGGGDCEDLVGEDLDCIDIAGCAFQANGDGAELHGVVFRRCRAQDYGRLGGSGVNLAQCRGPLLEDLTLIAHPLNDNPGINSYDGTSGTELRRYEIDADDPWAGPMDATPGEPDLPSPPGFVSIPEPGPEPEPEPGEGLQWCPSCGGSKRIPGPEPPAMVVCPRCAGEGTVPLPA